jgi:nicotinamidase/pyrazinamidase
MENIILWGVDCQADFMLPNGKLYVPGADHLLPNIRRLTDATRLPGVFLVSTGDAHSPNDSEFETFPPHCLKGTPGADLVIEALSDSFLRIENDPRKKLPEDLTKSHQILLEKQSLDIFDTCHADELVHRLDWNHAAQYAVFGVVMEYCVLAAARGLLKRRRQVVLVRDAIKSINFKAGMRAMDELYELGAKLVTTDEILSSITVPPPAR